MEKQGVWRFYELYHGDWVCGVVFYIRIRVFISVAGSGRNIGIVRNPLLLKGVTDASGYQTIKIIKRAHL